MAFDWQVTLKLLVENCGFKSLTTAPVLTFDTPAETVSQGFHWLIAISPELLSPSRHGE